ncbi:MAG: hypothetical protein ABR920_16595 [Terriglobales bacterium]
MAQIRIVHEITKELNAELDFEWRDFGWRSASALRLLRCCERGFSR